MMLRYGSVAAQLENDQFNDDECVPGANRSDVDAAWGRGWNAAIRHALDVIRIEAALRELAHAPVIQTIDQPLVDFSADTEAGR